MRLKLLVPEQVLIDREVTKVTAEGEHGSFCLLPRHVDFLAALVPGLLAFEEEPGEERFAAVDEGILVKRSDLVLVSAPQAILGEDLESLQQTVEQQFVTRDERELAARAAAAKLETTFVRSYLDLSEEEL